MPVNYRTPSPSQLFPVTGVRLGVAEAGIRKPDRRDLTLLSLAEGSRVAGVFTTNRFCAAPVQVCRRHLELGSDIRALVINTGVANAGTGEQGWQAAVHTCAATAHLLGIEDRQVLPFSTGVILDRRHPRTLAGRSSGGRPAALRRRSPGEPLARRSARHHDHRYGRQSRLAAPQCLRPDGDDHRHQQGCRASARVPE